MDAKDDRLVVIGMDAARDQLTQLVEGVAEGETFVITLRGVPVAQLGPVAARLQWWHPPIQGKQQR